MTIDQFNRRYPRRLKAAAHLALHVNLDGLTHTFSGHPQRTLKLIAYYEMDGRGTVETVRVVLDTGQTRRSLSAIFSALFTEEEAAKVRKVWSGPLMIDLEEYKQQQALYRSAVS